MKNYVEIVFVLLPLFFTQNSDLLHEFYLLHKDYTNAICYTKPATMILIILYFVNCIYISLKNELESKYQFKRTASNAIRSKREKQDHQTKMTDFSHISGVAEVSLL